MKNFESFLFLRITGPEFADKGTDIADIIGQSDTAEGLNEDEKHGLDLIVGRNISKAHSEHDGGAPVITPNILYQPVLINDVNFGIPGLLRIDSCHKVETNWQEMSDNKVDKQHLKQTVVLLLLVCLYVQVFVFFKSTDVIVQLYQGNYQNKYSDIYSRVVNDTHVYKKSDYTHKVYEKPIPHIVLPYLLQVLQFLTILKSLR